MPNLNCFTYKVLKAIDENNQIKSRFLKLFFYHARIVIKHTISKNYAMPATTADLYNTVDCK